MPYLRPIFPKTEIVLVIWKSLSSQSDVKSKKQFELERWAPEQKFIILTSCLTLSTVILHKLYAVTQEAYSPAAPLMVFI